MNTDQKDNLKLENIPLGLIDTEGQSVRDSVDDDHVVELAMNISKNGLLHPIVVKSKTNGRFQLYAGFHRLTAYHRLNRDTIPAVIKDDLEGPIKGIALVENIVRRNMSLEEEVKAVNYLNKDEGMSPSQICDLTGKGRRWVDIRLSVPGMPDDVRRELVDGNIGIGKADIISRITDEGTRALILNQVIHAKLTEKQTDELVCLYMDTPSIQSALEQGLQTAKEIQTQAPPIKECYTCKTHHRLTEIRFIPVCLDCEGYFLSHFVEHEKKESKDNGP